MLDRHCTHCQSGLEHRGIKRLLEGFPNFLQMETMPCHVYLCRNCGHVEFFAVIEAGEGEPES